ncbi:MAG: efflux RND transporter periplasmic adaptor subunit [Candidatus Aminicenantes bacterium]|nr:efflux RND transporter periplasmic adaptor subunit [Candidatus Aminicenantes bacterium]
MTKTGIGALIVALGLAAVAAGCGAKPQAPQAVEDTEESAPTIRLSPDGAAAAGLKTARVDMRSFSIPIAAFGLVQFDPRFHHQLTARVPGRVEEVLAFEGARVNAGRKLLTLYSPDFLSAQSELLQMLERQKIGERSGSAEERSMAQGLLQAAEKKLGLLGLGPDEIRNLKDKKEAALLLPVRAPIRGVVTECPVTAGSSVEAGALLLEISDLRTVRVEARVFEKDIARLEPGLRADISLAALPGEKFSGRLAVVGATVDEASRTIKAIIEVPNTGERLKPGMSASVTLVPRRRIKVLAVPESAVRKVEGRDLVFVAGPDRTFAASEVKVGRTLEGFVEIQSGLAEGQEVATEGSLALKSEMLKKNLEGE